MEGLYFLFVISVCVGSLVNGILMGAMDVRMIEEWRDEARRALTHEAEALKEQLYQRQCYMQALDATEDLVKEVKELEDH